MRGHFILSCYADFLYQLVPHIPGQPQHICADGKALNGAENRALTGKSLYIINIFLASYHLFTYQVRVGAKSQEGKVLENEIYDILYQDPALVTADAMATKKAILELICKAGSDAVLPVKKNNKNLMKCLLEFVVPLAQNESVDHYPDLNGFSEKDLPSFFVSNTKCAVYDEDNRNEPDENNAQPIDYHTFFNGLYTYQAEKSGEKPQTSKENKNLAWVRICDRWVPMSYLHGRFERREYELVSDSMLICNLYHNAAMEDWDNIAAVGLVTRYRGEYKRDSDTKERYVHISVTRTPYILTAVPESAEVFAGIVRNHWAIEEGHNCLDDLFDEDHCTVSAGHAPETCSLLRKMAYNMISMLDMRNQQPSDSCRNRRLKETLESLIHSGISGLKKLITRRFRSPFLS